MVARRGSRRKRLQIVILSGGTGRTGEQLVRSALAQFDGADVEIVVKPQVRTVKAAIKVVESAASMKAILCHTLVQPEVREAVVHECQLRGLQAVDLFGPTLSLLSDRLGGNPRNQPGLSHELNKEQFERIDAVDFTLAHDDGARAQGLRDADVVVVGVSRASKSVTCFYLAYRGIRAANVPLVPGIDPPAELLEVCPDRVVGLMMNPHRLQNIREARRGAIRAADIEEYSDLRHIAKELRQAQALIDKHGWRSIDVSYMAVEEAAAEIIEIVMKRAA